MPRTKQYNKDDVIERAMDLFWKQGFHATSMQDLVKHVGLNRSSLYESFENKKDLFDQALDAYCRNNQESVINLLSNETSAKVGIRKLLESSIVCIIKDDDKKGCFVVNSTTELIPGDESLLKNLAQNRELFEKVFYEFLLRGQKNGEISQDKDIKNLAGLIYTLFSGFSVIAKLDKSSKKLISQIDLIIELLN